MPDRPDVLISGFYLFKTFGFGRFTRELLFALDAEQSDVRVRVAIPKDAPFEVQPHYARVEVVRLPAVNLILWEQVVFPLYAAFIRARSVHHPCNTKQLWRWPGLRVVWTIHDLIFLTAEHERKSLKDSILQYYSKFVFRHGKGSAGSVVAVSDTTARALRAKGLESERIYNTIDYFLSSCASSPSMYAPSGKYILHRGGTSAHRNTSRVVAAFGKLRRTRPDLRLVVMGIAPQDASSFAAEPGVTILSRLSDSDLAGVYRGAACVVAPSLAEGFGLPILEGFGFGAPVVTSNVDPMAEVVGDAGLTVDPYSADSIAQAIDCVLRDPHVTERLRAAGRRRLATFSSQQVATSYVAQYTHRPGVNR